MWVFPYWGVSFCVRYLIGDEIGVGLGVGTGVGFGARFAVLCADAGTCSIVWSASSGLVGVAISSVAVFLDAASLSCRFHSLKMPSSFALLVGSSFVGPLVTCKVRGA